MGSGYIPDYKKIITGPAGNVDLVVNPDGSINTVSTPPTLPGTSTTTQVADSAASVQLLAANANRRGAAIANDSSAALHVKLGATASLTDYTARVIRNAYYEVPFGYTGRIDGIWESDPGDGAARITEITP